MTSLLYSACWLSSPASESSCHQNLSNRTLSHHITLMGPSSTWTVQFVWRILKMEIDVEFFLVASTCSMMIVWMIGWIKTKSAPDAADLVLHTPRRSSISKGEWLLQVQTLIVCKVGFFFFQFHWIQLFGSWIPLFFISTCFQLFDSWILKRSCYYKTILLPDSWESLRFNSFLISSWFLCLDWFALSFIFVSWD